MLTGNVNAIMRYCKNKQFKIPITISVLLKDKYTNSILISTSKFSFIEYMMQFHSSKQA